MEQQWKGRRMAGVVLLVTILVGGCAGYCIQDVKTGVDGYVIYEPWPYVQVSYTFNEGEVSGATMAVIYLPNRAKGYRVKSWSGFGKADFKFDFKDGWMLTGLHDKSDNTEVLKTLASFIPKPDALRGDIDAAMEPHLYKVEFGCDGGVSGLTQVPVSSIVTLPKEATGN